MGFSVFQTSEKQCNSKNIDGFENCLIIVCLKVWSKIRVDDTRGNERRKMVERIKRREMFYRRNDCEKKKKEKI